MSRCISIVGMQPAATAAALRSWSRHNGPFEQVDLLATSKAWEYGERLQDFLTKHNISQCVQVIHIADQLSNSQTVVTDSPKFTETISSDHNLIFFADPGPNYLVAALALSLPAKTAFMHADANFLHICRQDKSDERWESLPYEDISLEELADLYQFSFQETRSISSLSPLLKKYLDIIHKQYPEETKSWKDCPGTELPGHMRIGLSFGDDPRQTFELGYVLNGRLHGLAVINASDREEVLQHARNVQSLYLNGLRPEITILTDTARIAKRFRATFTPTIHIHPHLLPSNRGRQDAFQSLLNWVNQTPANPGRSKPNQSGNLKPLVCEGSGADGEALAVCLGNDPSSTLTSLFSHKPQIAYIFYDKNTPAVVNLAKRIQRLSQYIPVGRLKFIPTDHLGRGIRQNLIEHSATNKLMKLDITPGTKAQACALTRFRGGTHWSLDVRNKASVCLSKGNLTLPLIAPTLNVQTRITGGELVGYNEIQPIVNQLTGFLESLIQFLVWAGQNDPKGYISLYKLRTINAKKGNYLKVNDNEVTLRWANQTYSGTIRNDLQGIWLEQVTAWLLKAAGGNEVWQGVKWNWPDAPIPADVNVFKDEIDVVCRFDTRFLVVSCKAGRGKTPHTEVSKAKSQIEAVAEKNVGRLSIPLLVHVLAQSEDYNQTITARRGAVILGLEKFCKISTLKDCLAEIFQSRRGD